MTEGIEVRVTPADIIVTRNMAEDVAPMLARRLHPDRAIGHVLSAERQPDDTWHVVVEDRGPRRFANRTGIEAPR